MPERGLNQHPERLVMAEMTAQLLLSTQLQRQIKKKSYIPVSLSFELIANMFPHEL